MGSTYTVTKVCYQVLHLQVSGYNLGVQPAEMVFVSISRGF